MSILISQQEFSEKISVKKNNQLKEVKKIKNKTILTAALYGAFGVIILYLPQYILPDYFINTEYTIPYINFRFEVSIFELLYGFVLVGIEIWLLMKGDLKAVSANLLKRFFVLFINCFAVPPPPCNAITKGYVLFSE